MINLSSVGHCLKWNNQSVSNYNRSVNLNRDSGWPGFSSARLFGDGGFCKENPSWLSPSFGQCLSRRFPVFVVKGTAASSICVFSVDILSRFWGLSKNLLFDFQKDDWLRYEIFGSFSRNLFSIQDFAQNGWDAQRLLLKLLLSLHTVSFLESLSFESLCENVCFEKIFWDFTGDLWEFMPLVAAHQIGRFCGWDYWYACRLLNKCGLRFLWLFEIVSAKF